MMSAPSAVGQFSRHPTPANGSSRALVTRTQATRARVLGNPAHANQNATISQLVGIWISHKCKQLMSFDTLGRIALAAVLFKVLTTIKEWADHENVLPLTVKAQLEAPSKTNTKTTKMAKNAKLEHNKTSHVHVGAHYFLTSHGFHLYKRKWLPQDPNVQVRAVLFLVHGVAEHGGRYEHIGPMLANAGFAVFMVDHQGHGLSDGIRVYARRIEHLAEDYIEFVQHTLALDGKSAPNQYTKLPRFILGHSMGGAVTLLIHERSAKHNLSWTGVVLSSPALLCHPLSTYRRLHFLGTMASYLLPKFPIPCFPVQTLTTSETFADEIRRDPLVPPLGTTLRLGVDLVKTGVRFIDQADQFKSPLLIFHGDKDTITFPEGSQEFYDKCGSSDKTIKLYPGGLHELMRHDFYAEVVQLVVEWLDKHVPAPMASTKLPEHQQGAQAAMIG